VIDIWVLPAHGGEPHRLTIDAAEDEFPVWSADEKAIAYTSANTGMTRRIVVLQLDGGSRVVRSWPRHAHVNSWSSDGKWLLLSNYTKTHGEDLWALSIDGRNIFPVATSSANENGGAFSPNGDWVAYNADGEILLVSFPSRTIRRQVTTSGGAEPHWDAAGRLYYRSKGSLMMQTLSLKTGLNLDAPLALFRTDAVVFDLSRDGQHFLLQTRRPEHRPLHIRTNWFDDVRAKVK